MWFLDVNWGYESVIRSLFKDNMSLQCFDCPHNKNQSAIRGCSLARMIVLIIRTQ